MKEFNVIWFNPTLRKFEKYNIIPSLINRYNEEKELNKNSSFEEIKKFILSESLYRWWSKCEYEIILTDWPTQKYKQKIDIYQQIKMNIDIITEIFIDVLNN